jgi:hypothetical protein
VTDIARAPEVKGFDIIVQKIAKETSGVRRITIAQILPLCLGSLRAIPSPGNSRA